MRSPLDGAGCRIASPAPAGVGTPSFWDFHRLHFQKGSLVCQKSEGNSIVQRLQRWGLCQRREGQIRSIESKITSCDSELCLVCLKSNRAKSQF